MVDRLDLFGRRNMGTESQPFTLNDDTLLLFRAVGDIEFYSIMRSREFSCLPGGVGVKYFGRSLYETR